MRHGSASQIGINRPQSIGKNRVGKLGNLYKGVDVSLPDRLEIAGF